VRRLTGFTRRRVGRIVQLLLSFFPRHSDLPAFTTRNSSYNAAPCSLCGCSFLYLLISLLCPRKAPPKNSLHLRHSNVFFLTATAIASYRHTSRHVPSQRPNRDVLTAAAFDSLQQSRRAGRDVRYPTDPASRKPLSPVCCTIADTAHASPHTTWKPYLQCGALTHSSCPVVTYG